MAKDTLIHNVTSVEAIVNYEINFLMVAPWEGNSPLSLFKDTYSEEL